MQTVWKGSIAFGLVSIPVRLVSATEEKDVSFRQVHAEDGGRIKYKRVCSVDGEEVPYKDIAKGYEVAADEVVILTDEDFANLPIASNKSVEVVSFASSEEINPIALSKAYYLDPTGDPKPYVLLRDTLKNTNKVALVKVALRQRERLATIRPDGDVLVMQTMLWPDEVRQPSFKFMDADVDLRRQEMEMASTYVDALTEDFDPDQFHDHYREALTQLVEAKIAGHELTSPPETTADTSNVLDLVQALQASLAAAGQDRSDDESTANSKPAKRSSSTRVGSTGKDSVASTTEKSAKKAASKPSTKATAKKPAKRAAKRPAATRRSA